MDFPVVPHQCQEEEGNSVHQPVSLHIAQLLCFVCDEHTLLAHIELGIHHHSEVLSSRATPQPASSWSVPMSLTMRSAPVLVGQCTVSVGMILSFLKGFLQLSSAIYCVNNTSTLPGV